MTLGYLDHEMAHVARWDAFWLGLQNLVQAIYFFHPLVWITGFMLDAERERRVERFYRPYHAAVRGMVQRSLGDTVFSIHTFTDNYEGEARALEIGVLFDHDDEPAHQLVRHLEDAGFHVAPNEPWSGKAGLAYSPVRHAQEFGRCALEIEARQDLIVDESFAARLAEALASFFS